MERIEQAELGVAVLAGYRIPVIDPVPEANLARFQPKLTLGDHTRDSDDLISVWVQSSWLSGGQAFFVNAASQSERWWDSTADTERSNMLSLRSKTYETYAPSGVTGTFRPLGDYNDTFYGAWDTTLCAYDVMAGWSDTGLSLPAAPVEIGRVFDDKLYIALGGGGLAAFDDGAMSVTNVQDSTPANVNALSINIWDNKLAVLTTQGQYRTFDGTTWSATAVDLTVRDGSTPRKLVDYVDQAGDPTLYIITSRGIWAVDPVNAVLVRAGSGYPPPPPQGRAATVWRTTDMYIAVGPGVHQWNRDIFTPMGLDRNDGLRAELRGHIVDLCPEYNGLTALVAGMTGEDSSNTLFIQGTNYQDQQTTFPTQRSVSSVWRFNGYGWHKIWESASASGSPTWQAVGAEENGSRYDLWWGYGSVAYRHPLRINFHNPQQGIRAGIDHFQETGNLRTGRWNANMPAWPKLASHIDINLLDESRGSVTIEYQTDQSPLDTNGNKTWTTLGTASAVGRTRFYFGDDFNGPNGETYPVSEGIEFDWIEFRYTLAGEPGNDMTSPLVDSFVFKFIKVPLQTASWSLQVPIDFDEQFYDVGPNEMRAFLTSLSATNRFVPLVFRNETYRVLVAQTQADRYTGDNPHTRMQLIVLEVS
jgi:hypothetical protein